MTQIRNSSTLRTMISTYMFIPGSKRTLIQKSLSGQLHPNYFIYDFEDALRDIFDPDNEGSLKICARSLLASFLPFAAEAQTRYCLRINHVDTAAYEADLDFLGQTNPHLPQAIILPMASSRQDILRLANDLQALERDQRPVEIIPLIETQAGLDHLEEIAAAHSRVRSLCFGHIDYFFEKGQFPIPLHVGEGKELKDILRRMISVAKQHSKSFIDAGFYYYGHDNALAAHCRYLLSLAAGEVPLGKLVMHPSQLPIIEAAQEAKGQTVESPLSEEWPPADSDQLAREIIQAYETREDKERSVCRLGDRIIPPQMYLLAQMHLQSELK